MAPWSWEKASTHANICRGRIRIALNISAKKKKLNEANVARVLIIIKTGNRFM